MARLPSYATQIDYPSIPLPPEQQFLDAIHNRYPEAQIDSIRFDVPHVPRFSIDGDKRNEKTGWYIAHKDPVPVLVFGDWRTGETQKTRADMGRALSEEEQRAFDMQVEAAKEEAREARERIAQSAARRSAHLWNGLKEAPPNHPYLVKKGVKPYGLRVTSDNRLVMPIYNGGDLATLQYISPDGSKRMETDGEKSGNWFYIPAADETGKHLFMCEGYATGASIREATGHGVIVAIDAGNLVKVADKLASLKLNNTYTIVADNDESGAGQRYAKEASKKLNAEIITPPRIDSGKGTDANDYASTRGLDALRALLLHEDENRRLVTAQEYISDNEQIQWLIPDWVQSGALQMTYGASGSGKTFFVLQQCVAIACKKIDNWLGYPVQKHGKVIYLNGEGRIGFKQRLRGQCRYYGVQPKDLDMLVARWAENIDEPGAVEKICREIDRFGGDPPVLIVIDTLNAHMVGDENKAQDTSAFLRAGHELMKNYKNTTVNIIHHTGQGGEAQQRVRGSSAWRGAMDIETLIAVDNTHGRIDTIMAKQTKNKDSELPQPFYMDKVKIETGLWKEDGSPVLTLVLEPCGDQESEAEKTEKKKPKKKTQKEIMIEAFKSCANEYLDYATNKKAGVSFDRWREKTIERWRAAGMMNATPEKTFATLRSKLIEEQIIQEIGNYVYIITL